MSTTALVPMTSTAVATIPAPAEAKAATGSALVAAVEAFWAVVVERHPEIPAQVVVVTGNGHKGRTMTRGHWHQDLWSAGAERAPELFVSGQRMADGGRGVANTIIHEAAHALLHARGDHTGGTSRQNRYHTKKGFGKVAEELGLKMPETPCSTIGFSDCSMPDETAERYADEIAALDAALALAIGGGTGSFVGTTKKAAPTKVELSCGCRTLKVSEKRAAELADLECTRCAGTLEVQG